jgi:tetratricopeptide (TPR) repeat protein
LLQLAERDNKAARPYEILAAYTLVKGRDRRQAESYWEKAVERGSTNAYVYLQLAKRELRGIMGNPSLDYRVPSPVCEQIRKSLDRAVELRPDYMEAWESLAQLEAFSEKPRGVVINQVQAILPRMRNKANALTALAIIRWRIDDLDTCRAMLVAASAANPGPTAKNIIRILSKKLAQSPDNKTEVAPEIATPASIDQQ